ncbi:potassium/sodium hyperpolarization-activated cyclic nucleotide-gated channel 1-like isoform X1 [Lepisosteus oculatus]|uniref:potassium/sodium hyperpolarization-activated cyclic nucleotide-gated channel 1-like isoform X1 n=2 Tax=Lepisosteus oculatus TaxID=7918 RepID=UPI0035F5261A
MEKKGGQPPGDRSGRDSRGPSKKSAGRAAEADAKLGPLPPSPSPSPQHLQQDVAVSVAAPGSQAEAEEEQQQQAPAPAPAGCSCPGLKALFLPKLNKHSLYVYGSEGALERECARQQESGVCVIHPFSPLRNYYIMVMVVMTFLNLIAIPIGIAFLDGSPSSRGFDAFNLASDTIFILDIGVNFRMGIITDDSEVVILNPKEIRNHYLKTWFALDLISAFPIDYLALIIEKIEHQSDTTSYSASKLVRIIMFARIFSLVRLLRVSRLMRFFNEWERVSNANMEAVRLFIRIICLFSMILLLCHWNGCIQFFIPVLQNFPKDCWVVKENLTNASWVEQYSFGVFRALSHMIGISYGSVDPPTGEGELWVVMTSMVSGALMYTMMVANVAAMMTNVDAPSKAYRNRFNYLEDYMTYRKLPRDLRTRISNYYQARHQGKWFDESEILNLVSKSLREEILNILCADLLNSVPIFKNRDINFINAVLLRLKYEVFQEGDIIIRQNAPGDRMFFIGHGKVLVETPTFKKELIDGDYFGEICLLTKCKRTATVQALSLCKVFSLSSECFWRILQGFPEIKEELEKTARERLLYLRESQIKHEQQVLLKCVTKDTAGETSV